MTPEISTNIFLLSLFLLPGFLAFTVSDSLYKKHETREIEVTYKSFLHSVFIYSILYAIAETLGFSMVEEGKKYPLLAILVLASSSFIWGILISWFNSSNIPFKILAKIKLKKFELIRSVEPPNLYSLLLDPNYQIEEQRNCWLIIRKNGITTEGFVKYADVSSKNHLVVLTHVREIDENGNVINEHPNVFGKVVDLTKLEEGFEIYFVKDEMVKGSSAED